MRTRHPFPDVELGEFEPVTLAVDHERGIEVKSHPDATTKGIEYALGFLPHRGENRVSRRAAVANWQPPASPAVDGGGAPDETHPSRRALLKQRQRQRRGELDPELRRLQRRKAQTK